MESDRPGQDRGIPRLRVQLLGPMAVVHDGRAVALPASRKIRALLAYLAMAPAAVRRSRLCELLWDVPNDPRGELRWCLSKIRGLIDEPDRRRVDARDDAVRLDLEPGSVDALEIERAAETGIAALDADRLRALRLLFHGDFLDGLEIERSPLFGLWLTAQRRRFRSCQTAVLEHLAQRAPQDEAQGHVERWLQLAPFDHEAHRVLLAGLARRGRLREGEEHLAATIRLFSAEGLDCAPIREAWRKARTTGDRQACAVTPASPATVPEHVDTIDAASTPARRASVAVMPFVDQSSGSGARGRTGDALAHDVITRLAKLRSLFVIAQGTVEALHERCIGPEEAGRMLSVDYVAGGSVQRRGRRLTVAVELTETRSARIVWSETFDQRLDDAFLVLDEIGDRIVAAIAGEIEAVERNRAILIPPGSLDAWEAHHRGLWHMYRFNRTDNERAQHSFQVALRLDPTFARAHAGLSFTHFQNAFQGWAERGPEIDRAYEAAGQSLMADDRDPAAHWAMGRAMWLRGEHDPSVAELEQAVQLSPNFALGHYTLAFVHSQAGDPEIAIAASDHSRHLSPFDPLLFGMLGTRAMALVRLGRFEEAADWGVRAAARPNAHAHIRAIAAFSLALAGRLDDARGHLAAIRAALPSYRTDDFLTAMRLAPDGAALYREAARRVGMG